MMGRQNQRVYTGKERFWAIRIRRHLWVFTMPQRIWKSVVAAVCALCALAVFYSAYLVYSVGKSNQELALIASAENGYMEKNWQETARGKQILLFASELYTKRAGMRASRTDKEGSNPETDQRDIRFLREPYPIDSEVERLLGQANRQVQEASGEHWIWYRTRWKQPEGWPAKGTVEIPWPHVEERLLEAWCDSRGELTSLMIARKELDGSQSWEHIGRKVGDWKILPSEEQTAQPGKSGAQALPGKSG
jgi:hypothetical protein